MKIEKLVAGWVVAGALCVCGTYNSQATLAYDFSGVTGNQNVGAFSLGTLFAVGASPVVINSLGAFDNGGDGLAQPISVAIYSVELSGSTITAGSLAISPLTISSADTLSGNTRTVTVPGSILARTLTTGTYMVVANSYGGPSSGFEQNYNSSVGGTPPTANGGGLMVFGGNYYNLDPNLSWAGTLPAGFTFGTATPTPGYAAGNFDFTPVPEASQFALAGMGLLGLVYAGRCFLLRRRAIA